MSGLVALALVALGASPFGARFSPFPTPRVAPLTATARASQEVPRNDGWITDLAGLLGAERERALEARMEAFRADPRGAEIAVLTVPSLAGRPIESLALETSRAWGIGSKETQRGALLVVAREEREIRIEVGDGLEGDITDAESWRVIQKVIVPRFRQGDFAGGIEAGVLALQREAGGGEASGSGAQPAPDSDAGALVIPLVFALLVAGVVISRARRRGIGGPFGSPPRGPFGRGRFPHGPFSGGLGGGLGGGRSSGGGFSGGGFRGFGGGGGFSGGGASGRW